MGIVVDRYGVLVDGWNFEADWKLQGGRIIIEENTCDFEYSREYDQLRLTNCDIEGVYSRHK